MGLDKDKSIYDTVKWIIDEVGAPVVLDSRSGRNADGVDLRPHEAALRRLLVRAIYTYLEALDDWKARNDDDDDRDKPRRRLEDNCSESEDGPVHDYSELVEADHKRQQLREWDEHWRRFYGRGRGRPNRNARGEPVEPLHPVYQLVRQFWMEHVDPDGFRPDYPRSEDKGDPKRADSLREERWAANPDAAQARSERDDDWTEREAEVRAPRADPARFNPAGRLLLLIAQELDPRYTPNTCANLYDTMKRSRRRRGR